MEEPTKFDRVLSKYVAVWIWSILFGTTTGFSYSITNLSNSVRDWGGLALGLAAIYLYATIIVFISWISLYRFLKGYIIPVYFFDAELEKEEKEKSFKYLLRSFQVLMISLFLYILLRLVGSVLESGSFGDSIGIGGW